CPRRISVERYAGLGAPSIQCEASSIRAEALRESGECAGDGRPSRYSMTELKNCEKATAHAFHRFGSPMKPLRKTKSSLRARCKLDCDISPESHAQARKSARTLG